jgi:hypothetical protein
MRLRAAGFEKLAGAIASTNCLTWKVRRRCSALSCPSVDWAASRRYSEANRVRLLEQLVVGV